MAVLARSNEGAREVAATLEAAGLPYLYLASRGLYGKPVILDVIAYLKLLDNYHDSPSVYRVLNLEVFKFTPPELINFNYIARKKAWSLFTVLKEANQHLGAATREKIAAVLDLIGRHTALSRSRSASEIIIAFLNDSGSLKALAGNDSRQDRENIAYLNRFMKRVRDFEAQSDDKSVKAFLGELELEIESGEEGVIAPDSEAGPEAIKVMTVHAAKGLEFKYAFIASLVDKRFPTIEHKEPIPLPDALVKEVLPAGDIHLEEERRLFYVAVTRARAGVFFSWAPDYGGARKKKPSRFLIEAGLIDGGNMKTNKNPAYAEASAVRQDKKITNYKLQITNYGQDRNEKPKIQDEDGKIYAVNLPSYFSYTQLAAFQNCPYQYRFAHILKVPVRSKHTFSFGQTMHLALQRIFQAAGEKKGLGQGQLFSPAAAVEPVKKTSQPAPVSPAEIKAIYEKSWIDDWYESPAQKEEYRELGEKSLKQFFEKHKDNWPRAIALEQGINLKIGGYRIYGKIDRIDETAAGIQIVDYKTGNPKSGEKIGPEDKEQLLIYQLAAEQIYGQPIANLQFYYLNDNSEINFTGNDKELREMEMKIVSRIGEIIAAAKANHWPAKPSPLCQYCDFYGICEYRKA
jgi:DNA helicase-2/ATP-dependent DNA helicase PcrA